MPGRRRFLTARQEDPVSRKPIRILFRVRVPLQRLRVVGRPPATRGGRLRLPSDAQTHGCS
jgi:hypothetical protein